MKANATRKNGRPISNRGYDTFQEWLGTGSAATDGLIPGQLSFHCGRSRLNPAATDWNSFMVGRPVDDS